MGKTNPSGLPQAAVPQLKIADPFDRLGVGDQSGNDEIIPPAFGHHNADGPNTEIVAKFCR